MTDYCIGAETLFALFPHKHDFNGNSFIRCYGYFSAHYIFVKSNSAPKTAWVWIIIDFFTIFWISQLVIYLQITHKWFLQRTIIIHGRIPSSNILPWNSEQDFLDLSIMMDGSLLQRIFISSLRLPLKGSINILSM